MVTWSFAVATAVALHGAALAAPQPFFPVRRADAPLADLYPADFDFGVCAPSNDYDSEETRISIWEGAHGGEIIDAYLNLTSRDYWASDLWTKAFPERQASEMDCTTSEAECSINGLECSAFEEHGASGVYQVFVALTHFHTFVKEYLEQLQDVCGAAQGMVKPIAVKLGVHDGEDEPINVLAIMSGAFSVASGATAAIPPASGGFGMASGVTTIWAEVAQDPAETPRGQLTEAGLAEMVTQTCTSAKAYVLRILEAVVGVPGSSEADIPEQMKVAYDYKRFEHAIAYMFGNGQWLVNHPTNGTKTHFENAGKQIKQGMAWSILRGHYRTVLVINDSSPCDDPNEVRDEENGYCYGLMTLIDRPEADLEEDNLAGSLGDLGASLWASEQDDGFGMDKLATYRNALDCWLSNDAKVGAIEPNGDLLDPSVPKCFFGIEVKKGSWHDYGGGNHAIELDGGFPNGLAEDYGPYWPYFEWGQFSRK